MPGSFDISYAVKGPRSVTLAWGEASGATSYTVKYGATAGTYGTVASTNATSPYTVTGLTGTYYFMVQAVNSDGTKNATSEKLASQIVVGQESEHSCYVSASGTLKCWGYNSVGQLGKGNTTDLGDGAGEMGSSLSAIDLGTGRTVRQLAMGAFFNCAILDNSTVKCWGDNQFGNLGLGHTNNLGDGASEMGDNLAAVDLGTGRTPLQITAGINNCVILDNNSVKCWGYNSHGQLGYGNTTQLGYSASEMGDNLSSVSLGL